MDNDTMRIFLDVKVRKFMDRHNIDYNSKTSSVIINSLGFNPLYKESIIRYLNNKFNRTDIKDVIERVRNVETFSIITHMLYDNHCVGHLRSVKKIVENLSILERNISGMVYKKYFFQAVLKTALRNTVIMALYTHRTDYETTYDKLISLNFKIAYSVFNSSIEPFKCTNTIGSWLTTIMIVYASSGTVSRIEDMEPRVHVPRTLSSLNRYKTNHDNPESTDWLSSVVVKRADLLTWDDISMLSSINCFIWDDYLKYREDYI